MCPDGGGGAGGAERIDDEWGGGGGGGGACSPGPFTPTPRSVLGLTFCVGTDGWLAGFAAATEPDVLSLS
jgi:hypothetical protein